MTKNKNSENNKELTPAQTEAVEENQSTVDEQTADQGDAAGVKDTNAFESEFKQASMSDEYKEIFGDMKGDYLYTGAPLNFECRKHKEHTLVAGKTYAASKLPKHELIANAVLRGFLVKVEEKKEA